MDQVLLDTDVFSFFQKRDTRGVLYRRHLADAEVFLCFQTVAELQLWAQLKRWGEKRNRELDAAIARCIIIPYDRDMAFRWAVVSAERRRVGRPIECGDAWIAAAAVYYALPLLTHNAADFEGISGLQVITYRDF